MKKVLVVLLIAIVSLSAVFAAELDLANKATMNKAYRPVFINRMNRLAFDLWENPAELADDKMIIDFPEIGVSVNNLASVLSDEKCRKDIVDAEYINLVKDYIKYTGNGRHATNDLVVIDLGFGSQAGGFAFRTDINVDVNTHNEAGYASLTTVDFIPEVNAALSFGYGMTILDTDLLTLKAGASVHPTLRVFTKPISATVAMTALQDENGTDALIDMYKEVYVGFATPVDASVSVGFLQDQLRAYVQANNMFGGYKFIQEDYDKLPDSVEALLNSEDKFDAGHFTLDIGGYFEPNLSKLVTPSAYLEFSDVYDLVKEAAESKTFEAKDFLPHLGFGANVDLLNVIKLGFAYKDGYRQLSAGVGINDICVQAVYGAKEYNNNTADQLSVIVKLGWDKN